MNKKGFTLVELLAVIVVLGLVITITATKGFGAFDNTKKAITKQNLNAIKEAANVLAEQIDNCDDDIDSELWDDNKGNLAQYNGITTAEGANCDALKEKMIKIDENTGCIRVTVDYLITNQYLSENKDFENLKEKEVKLCKEDKKIVVNTGEIENESTENSGKDNNDKKNTTTTTATTTTTTTTTKVQNEENKKTLAKTIIASAKAGGTNRTTYGREVTTFTSISVKNERVLNTAPDDYGTSYYYRGNVLDNYVTFAKKTWRIVRINGDGSVRLVLDDWAKYSNGNEISSAFNSNRNDNAYVGYMYGTPGSTTYNATHKNINDSTIKTVVDKWYEDSIKTNYANYLADTLFCNDKTLASNGIGGVETQLGYGTNDTHYSSFERLTYYYRTEITLKPTFKCAENASNDYSRFTVNVTILPNRYITNGNLKYPIGLLTSDEVVYAGAYFLKANNSYYLYNSSISSTWWWLASPYTSAASSAHEWIVNGIDGSLGVTEVSNSFKLRPSINLKASVLVSGGNGTKGNPYTVKLS